MSISNQIKAYLNNILIQDLTQIIIEYSLQASVAVLFECGGDSYENLTEFLGHFKEHADEFHTIRDRNLINHYQALERIQQEKHFSVTSHLISKIDKSTTLYIQKLFENINCEWIFVVGTNTRLSLISTPHWKELLNYQAPDTMGIRVHIADVTYYSEYLSYQPGMIGPGRDVISVLYRKQVPKFFRWICNTDFQKQLQLYDRMRLVPYKEYAARKKWFVLYILDKRY